jgi:P27 family predicted phage terminase small subunit
LIVGARGPKPLPVNVHLLRNNAAKKPLGQLLDDVVRPDVAIPTCPQHLGDEARKEWRRISKHLAKLGLISQIDRAALAGYCQSWGRWVEVERKIAAANAADPDKVAGLVTSTPAGYQQISVLMQISNRCLEQMKRFLAEFGMSPAARSRVTASDAQGELPGFEKPSEGGWASFS